MVFNLGPVSGHILGPILGPILGSILGPILGSSLGTIFDITVVIPLYLSLARFVAFGIGLTICAASQSRADENLFFSTSMKVQSVSGGCNQKDVW